MTGLTQKYHIKKIKALSEGYGPRIAFHKNMSEWATARLGQLALWENTRVVQHIDIPGYVDGAVYYSDDGQEILVGPWAVSLASGQKRFYPYLQDELIAAIDPKYSPRRELFSITNAIWSPDGRRMVALSRYRPSRLIGDNTHYDGPDAQLLLLDGEKGQFLHALEENCGAIRDRSLAVHANQVAAGGTRLSVWDIHTGETIAHLPGVTAMLKGLTFKPDGTLLAGIQVDGSIILWETNGWKLVTTWSAHPGLAQALAFHPHHPLLASGGSDGVLRLWSLETENPTPSGAYSLGKPIQGMAFEPEGNYLVVAASLVEEEMSILSFSTL